MPSAGVAIAHNKGIANLNPTKQMAMIPINEAKQRSQNLIDTVNQSHQPLIIAGKSSNAILFFSCRLVRYSRDTASTFNIQHRLTNLETQDLNQLISQKK